MSKSFFPHNVSIWTAVVIFAASHAAQAYPSDIATKLGVDVTKPYHGDGLALSATAEGAQLLCTFQKLEGQVTSTGLWLQSTGETGGTDRFNVRAVSVQRPLTDSWLDTAPLTRTELSTIGHVTVRDEIAQFARPGLTEEYSVSADGVRQDFIVAERPAGNGDLRVELEIIGAQAAAADASVRLTLNNSGRELNYHRLYVVDARDNELPARLEVLDSSRVAVIVEDATAIYPIRIDPTFCDADWVSLGGFPGTRGPGSSSSGTVWASAADEYGNLYVAGGFNLVHDISANRIAKWDGTKWSALGLGLNGNVTALAVSGSNVYVGGTFTEAGGVPANHIAKWDGSTWTALGDGVDDTVQAIAITGQFVYAGGNFTTAGGSAANRVARWNGNAWSPLGAGLDSEDFKPIRTMAVYGSDLIVGGNFNTADGTQLTNLAKWNGSIWSAVGSIEPRVVNALLVTGNTLYQGTEDGNVASWDGNAWTYLGGLGDSGLKSLAMVGSDLYAGGSFTFASPRFIAKWNGSNWEALANGIHAGGGGVQTITGIGSNLYVGGWFEFAGNFAAHNLACWNGQQWSTVGAGMDYNIRAVTVSGADSYAAGGYLGLQRRVRVSKWNGTQWTTLGSGMGNGMVLALAASHASNVYAGGTFSTAGGVAAKMIARWDGTTWLPLGVGMNDWVRAIAVDDTNVYAGGKFITAGATAANYIARWDGTTWHSLGSGMNDEVHAVAVSGSNIYAGGMFTTADGSTVNHIARWDGNSWSALGSGVDGDVYAIAIRGSNVYVGGSFTNASGIPVNNIAVWNGNSWAALDEGLDGSVMALTVSGNCLYAGGAFTNASGTAVNHIARWDGDSWSALGVGLGAGGVNALAAAGPKLFVGGNFLTAGDKISAYVAQANVGTAPGRFINPSYSPATGFSCTFVDGTPGRTYRIQLSPAQAGGSWTQYQTIVYAGPVVVSIPPGNAVGPRYFRAIAADLTSPGNARRHKPAPRRMN